MKSPSELAKKLARQWHNAEIRQRRLLCADEWPLDVPIGKVSSKQLLEQPALVREHLHQWRQVDVGKVHCQERKYRGTSAAIAIPAFWQLKDRSEWIAACDDVSISQEFTHFEHIIKRTDSLFHALIIRQRHAIMARSAEEVVQIADTVLALRPGCADDKPLRLLSINGCDSKFFERNRFLVTQMLSLRFPEVDDVGLEPFLHALDENDHWLLVAPLDKGLLPFSQQRVRACELMQVVLPASHILVIENERCLYQLPALADTIAILGAGLHLNWLDSPFFAVKNLAYWGDIDTWGLMMLAKAREFHPNIQALMMDGVTFNSCAALSAVVEPVVASDTPPLHLLVEEQRLFYEIVGRDKGRLEQEFIPVEWVRDRVMRWVGVG